MKNVFKIFLFLFVGNLLLAQTYTITVDGNPSDWDNNDGGYDGSQLATHGSGYFNGQFIYKGANGDNRNDGTDPDGNYDITEVRIGSSSTDLFFLIKFDDITSAGLPIVSIAFRSSSVSGGFNYIGDGAETGTSSGTYLNNDATNVIDIHDPNNDGADPEFNTGSGFTNRGTAIISTINDCIEYSIAYSQLNGSITSTSTIYLSVICGEDNDTFANLGDAFKEFSNSDALDGMTIGGLAGNFWEGRGGGGVGSSDFDVESGTIDLTQSALPVELTSFTASVKEKIVTLNWETATEVNNYGFEILRSQMSEVQNQTFEYWEEIGFVEGHGNSNSPKSYNFTDNTAAYGNYAYRLKQIDTDGKFEYSNTVEVFVGDIPNGFVLEQNYPNPFNPTTKIRFGTEKQTEGTLKVYNTNGEEVAEVFSGSLDAGRIYEVEFNAADLSSGIYIYRLKTGEFSSQKKLMLVK